MTKTLHLICPETGYKIWFGDTKQMYHEPHFIMLLHQFLKAHEGKVLKVVGIHDAVDYKEFGEYAEGVYEANH